MNLDKIIQKISGKEDFTLSSSVPLSYILCRGGKYIFSLLRGILSQVGMKSVDGNFFVGKKVKFFCKSKIVIGNRVRIEDNVKIDALSENGVILGDRVKIGENSKIICSGTLSDLGKGIKIGRDTSFSENTFFGAAGGIEIGDDVIAGQNVRFHSENHNFIDIDKLIRLQGVNRRGIRVGNNVWIGAGTIFLDGSDVGDGCVLAANSIITKKIEQNSVVVGTSKILYKRG